MRGRRIRVRGQVQGVGFRPFVWHLARDMGLCGDVRNDGRGVLIHVAGADLDGFETALRAQAPPLARIDGIESTAAEIAHRTGFQIILSGAGGAQTRATPDAATCAACLEEINDPSDRRHGYCFANCTHCGPRFSILQGFPYDRAKTTMAVFPMCPDCAREYESPEDRRFHAQPVACPACGPRLWLEPGQEGDPLGVAVGFLRRGAVLAIKGLGGFHLAVDAQNAQALALLRQRKHRPAKPFALMGTMAQIRRFSTLSDAEAALLSDPAAPIVLLAKAGQALPEAVAPGQACLGWMLPHTPLHHLLLAAFDGPLVMTSGNVSGEPQAIGNREARERLGDFADLFLMHDRDIARRLDDSVERITAHGPMVLRRGRGRVPDVLPLPPGFDNGVPVLAYGGQMKAAICLIKNDQMLLGHHLGDLDGALCWEAFLQAEADYTALFEHEPALVACDLHPAFRATRHAVATGLPLIKVAHHHAHLASCLGENAWPRDGGPVAGIILDGLGLGLDGTLWGGELILGDYVHAARVAHLVPAALPGGDAAQRTPWRNLLVRLDQAGLGGLADDLLEPYPIGPVRQAVRAGINAPISSSAGRLFDAFAAGLGLVRGAQSFEGEAAMRLEALAMGGGQKGGRGYSFGDDPGRIDPVPMFHDWARERLAGVDAADMAWRFHAGLARAFARRARDLVLQGRARAVALSGGCFQNALLCDLTVRALEDVPILLQRQIPANDGGLALGQALIAAAQHDSEQERN